MNEVTNITYALPQQSAIRRSASIGKIGLALSKAQGAFKAPAKDTKGQVGTAIRYYAAMDSVIEAIQEALSVNEIAYTQPISSNNGKLVVTTLLIHSSGEWMESDIEAGPMGAAQATGSLVTYFRRYALQSALGVAPSDQDDDGQAATDSHRQQPQQQNGHNGNGRSAGAPQGPRAGLVSEPPPAEPNDSPEAQALFDRFKRHPERGKIIAAVGSRSIGVKELAADPKFAAIVKGLVDGQPAQQAPAEPTGPTMADVIEGQVSAEETVAALSEAFGVQPQPMPEVKPHKRSSRKTADDDLANAERAPAEAYERNTQPQTAEEYANYSEEPFSLIVGLRDEIPGHLLGGDHALRYWRRNP